MSLKSGVGRLNWEKVAIVRKVRRWEDEKIRRLEGENDRMKEVVRLYGSMVKTI